jgi:hypothetical protein
MSQQRLSHNGGSLDGPDAAGLFALKAKYNDAKNQAANSKQTYFKGVKAIVVATDGSTKIDVNNRWGAAAWSCSLLPLLPADGVGAAPAQGRRLERRLQGPVRDALRCPPQRQQRLEDAAHSRRQQGLQRKSLRGRAQAQGGRSSSSRGRGG